MSAYVVEDKTINRIVYYLQFLHPSSNVRRELLTVANLDAEDGDKLLAGAMFMLNCNAVDQRYPGHAKSMPDAFRPLDYGYSPLLSTQIQVFKSLRCWLYQCSEGNIPDTSDLYKVMEKVSGHMALEIVSNLPEYEAAEWG
jgi:hypothetical protein